MNEKFANLIRAAKNHLDRIVVAVIVLLLLAQVGLWMKEKNFVLDPLGVKPSEKPEDPTDPDWVNLVQDTYGKDKDVTQDELVDGLIKFNMFDVKAVKSQEDINRDIADKFQRAKSLYNQGKKQESLDLLNEILQLDRSYLSAIDLKSKIEAEIKPPTEPAPAPAPPPESEPVLDPMM
jgi:hypothetical protein